jgi:hypothetical protein
VVKQVATKKSLKYQKNPKCECVVRLKKFQRLSQKARMLVFKADKDLD